MNHAEHESLCQTVTKQRYELIANGMTPTSIGMPKEMIDDLGRFYDEHMLIVKDEKCKGINRWMGLDLVEWPTIEVFGVKPIPPRYPINYVDEIIQVMIAEQNANFNPQKPQL